AGDERRELVLESFQVAVRERQVVRIGADAERARVRRFTAGGAIAGAHREREAPAPDQEPTGRASHGSENTYNMPPLVLCCGKSAVALTNPSAAVGSAESRSPATIAPAQPPTPERIATY